MPTTDEIVERLRAVQQSKTTHEAQARAAGERAGPFYTELVTQFSRTISELNDAIGHRMFWHGDETGTPRAIVLSDIARLEHEQGQDGDYVFLRWRVTTPSSPQTKWSEHSYQFDESGPGLRLFFDIRPIQQPSEVARHLLMTLVEGYAEHISHLESASFKHGLTE